MADRKDSSVIIALKDKASDLRKIANDLGFEFSESAVLHQDDVIRFTFDLNEGDIARLVDAVPIEVYAHRAYVGPVD
jgi:hypothetical protein